LTDTNKPFEGSLHNKIDLLRVKDARKAFRHKYAERNTIDRIFERYDSGGKGFIDAKDLLKQAKSIGIQITLDEAQVLL
jgi:Ca2+-binding EF-hand superfamily protein